MNGMPVAWLAPALAPVLAAELAAARAAPAELMTDQTQVRCGCRASYGSGASDNLDLRLLLRS